VRAASGGWIPTGDDGYTALRAWDTLSAHPPLRGSISSLSWQLGYDIYHPGTLQYDVLAIPVRLAGRGWGTALGIALTKVAAVVTIAWLMRRRFGPPVAVLAVAAVATLEWSMGSERLFDPWHAYAGMVPYALLMVAVWSIAAGDPAGLVPMVLAGSYVTSAHLSFVVPVGGLMAFAAVVCVLRLRRLRRGPDWPRQRARALRWGALTGVVTLACWARPLWQQFRGPDRGNLVALAGASRSVDLPTMSFGDVVGVFGGTVALPPWWLPPSFGSPAMNSAGSTRPVLWAAAGLVALVALLGVLGWRAWRRGATAIVAGVGMSLVALAFGVVTATRIPVHLGLPDFYTRWMWPLATVVWLVVAVALLDELRTVRPQAWMLRHLAVVGAFVAVVAGAFTLPTVDNAPPNPAWSIDATKALADDVIAAADGRPVVVSITIEWPTIYTGPSLLGELQDAGVPFRLADDYLVAQAGDHYRPRPEEDALHLDVRGGRPHPWPGETVVATWTAPSGRNDETVTIYAAPPT